MHACCMPCISELCSVLGCCFELLYTYDVCAVIVFYGFLNQLVFETLQAAATSTEGGSKLSAEALAALQSHIVLLLEVEKSAAIRAEVLKLRDMLQVVAG